MLSTSFRHRISILGLGLLVAAGAFAGATSLVWGYAAGQTATSPAITLTPTSAVPNGFVAVSGEGFTTGGAATIASISLGGAAVVGDKINFGAPVKVDSSGNFVTNLVVPVNSTTLTPGGYAVTATDSGGKSASATLTISTPAISLTPASSRAGSTITITGSGFPLNVSAVGTDQVPLVSINYAVSTGTTKEVATIYPDASGAFTTTFEVPLNVVIPSESNKVAAAMSGSTASITTTHSVTEPTVSISPASGAPGTAVTITGAEFNSFIQVKSLSVGGIQVSVPDNLTTDANGKFTLTATVPTTETGTQPVLVEIGSSTRSLTFTMQSGTDTSSTTPVVIEPVTIRLTEERNPLGGNLERAFHFDNATKQWSFYDTDPDLAPFVTLTEMVTGKPYWIKVKRAQAMVIGGVYRDLFEGWNLVAW